MQTFKNLRKDSVKKHCWKKKMLGKNRFENIVGKG